MGGYRELECKIQELKAEKKWVLRSGDGFLVRLALWLDKSPDYFGLDFLGKLQFWILN